MIVNGDSSAKARDHRSKRVEDPSSNEEHHKASSNKQSGGDGRDESKKSLSFFPDDSGEDSADEEGANGRENDNNNCSNSSDPPQPDVAGLKEPVSSVRAEIELNHKVAVPMESDQEDSSSTSSCSCEEHSSVSGKSDEDPHGDLDYDDDSITNSPARGEKRSADSAADDESETAPGRATIVDPGSSNGRAFSITNPSDPPSSQPEDEPNGTEPPQQKQSTKIRSFINLDRAEEIDNGIPLNEAAKRQLKDRSHKSYESLLRYFFKDACYFQIKSINHENVAISKSMGVWSTPMQNEIRLNTAFREHRNVILVFSVQQSGAFQGFARMISESKPAMKSVPWVLPGRLSNATLGGVFQVQWLCTKELDFNKVRELHNPFNNNKPIKVARDGQQVEPKVGRKLCSLFPRDSKKRLLSCVEKLKAQTKQRKQSMQARNGYYPMHDQREGPHARRNMHGPHDHHLAMMNGYGPMSVGPSSSHTPIYHPYSTDHNGLRGPPAGARRRLGGPFLHPAQRRGGPHLEINLSHRAAYDDAMFDYGDPSQAPGLGYPNLAHNGFHPNQHHYHQYPGPDYQGYPGAGPPVPLPAPMMGLGPQQQPPPPHQHPRAYYHEAYSMGPARYHPYQRGRR